MELQTQCKNGHPWPENMGQTARQRYCKACAREASARHRRKRGMKMRDSSRCSQGHERTEKNTYVRPDGYPECKICRYEKQKMWRETNVTPKKKLTLYEKIMSAATYTESGCLVVNKYLNGHGYVFVREGPRGSVRGGFGHRIAWEEEVGPIPDGLVIDHLCSVRNCINVDHLEPVTQRVNARRGTRPDPDRCRSGRHDWIPDNIYTWTRPNGNVMSTCRLCREDRKKGH